MPTLRFFRFVSFFFLLVGCGKVSPDSLRQDTTRARDEARAACEAREPKKATKAADRAADLAQTAKKLKEEFAEIAG